MHVRVCLAILLVGPLGFFAGGRAGCAEGKARHVAPDETWEMREGRFFRNGQWVFLKNGKLLESFEKPETADRVLANIDVMIDRLGYNSFSLNVYPCEFDPDADGRVSPSRSEGYDGIRRIIDHCWRRGVFCSLSFETYNVGGGGVPETLFKKHPDIVAVNALGEPARDVEYVADVHASKRIPSIFHPAYLKWTRDFMADFLRGLGRQRTSRLLYVETTVEPQYLGQCNAGDRDPRRAAFDFSDAARTAFEAWRAALPKSDPRRDAYHWPTTQAERDGAVGSKVFNEFRGEALGRWVTGDILAIRSVAPDVYVAVDYNGRFDDPKNIRVGDHDAFLKAIDGADIIQIAPHVLVPWGTSSWDDVIRVNQREKKGWAISEHMTVNGTSPEDDGQITGILENTLARGTRWGWDCVAAGNRRKSDRFHLYYNDWTSPVLDVIEGANWEQWLSKIGVPRFVPKPRAPIDTLSR